MFNSCGFEKAQCLIFRYFSMGVGGGGGGDNLENPVVMEVFNL
jgi:hypothetical protein